MPTEIVIVRHGLCTGNAADRASRKGDHSLFTPELLRQNSSDWPLLPFGIQQSQETGRRIRDTISERFDHYFTSDILRAIETAKYLGFKDAIWESDPLLRERKWGGVENLPYPERNRVFERTKIPTTEDSMKWRPPRGESMLIVIRRMQIFLTNARQRFAGKKLLVVAHGAPIQAMRVLQHRISSDDYVSFIGGDNYIRNCHIFRYFVQKVGSTVPMYEFEYSSFLGKNGDWIEKTRGIR